MFGTFDPKAAALDVVASTRSAVGDRLVNATLYGSAAMGTFDRGRSDINMALVFLSLDGALLDALRPAHRLWHRKRLVRPLLLTPEILETSRDTFPLEYLLIRAHHQTIHGADPFAAMEIQPKALRLQVERTLRTQGMALAWSYLDAVSSPSGARHWAHRAGTAIAASASGLLHLAGESIPSGRTALASRVSVRFGIAEEMLRRVLLPPSERPAVEAGTLVTSAREVVQRLLEAADRMDGPPERTS